MIKADIGHRSIVERVILDIGSSMNVLYHNTFIKMGYKREDLSPSKEIIYEFTNTATSIVGVIKLKTSIGMKKGWVR